jgi:hypothetical protein
MGGRFIKDVLDYLDITDYSSITLASSDIFSVRVYTRHHKSIPLTILATSVNGKDNEA